MPNLLDLLFAVVVFVGGPLLDYFLLWPSLLRRVTAGESGARIRFYGITLVGEWLPTLFVIARWKMLARPWSALWLLPPHGGRLVASAVAALAVAVLFLSQIRALSRLSPAKRSALRSRVGQVTALIPHTSREHRWFMLVSLTAGICEELLYRRFLVWLLQAWIGFGWAAVVSVVAFGAGHAYQGKEVVRPTVVGAALQGLAIITWSILPGIVVHALLDAMSGTAGYFLCRESATGCTTAANPVQD